MKQSKQEYLESFFQIPSYFAVVSVHVLKLQLS